MRGSCSAELVLALLEPVLGLLEGGDSLPLRPGPDGCLTQAQEQGSPLTLFCGKEFEGDAIVLQGLFRCRGLPCLLGSATSVVCSACTVATLGEVEGQIGEVLRTSPVSLGLQDATNEAMQAPPPSGEALTEAQAERAPSVLGNLSGMVPGFLYLVGGLVFGAALAILAILLLPVLAELPIGQEQYAAPLEEPQLLRAEGRDCRADLGV